MKPVKHDDLCIAASEADKKRFWNKVDKTDSCWPYGSNKSRYGKFHISGVTVNAHRVSKLWQTSLPRAPKNLACHKCTTKNCVRPSHVYWGTVAQNNADRIRDKTNKPISHQGEMHPLHKLSKTDVHIIRQSYGRGKSFACIANRFGVSAGCVARVVRNETWKHMQSSVVPKQLSAKQKGYARCENHHAAKLSEKDVEQIRILLRQNMAQRKIAALFKVSQGCVADIRHGRTWA